MGSIIASQSTVALTLILTKNATCMCEMGWVCGKDVTVKDHNSFGVFFSLRKGEDLASASNDAQNLLIHWSHRSIHDSTTHQKRCNAMDYISRC
jgi:hypothetical protein